MVAAAIALGAAVQMYTVPRAPADWLDSVQIAEIARPMLDGDSGAWGMNILPERTQCDGPWAFYWLGSAAQDCAFRVLGPDAPRLVSLCFHVAAAALAWTLSGHLAAFATFAFLPLAQSVRYGRVDSIAIAFLLLALVLARSRLSVRSPRLASALSGSCAACALMSWFSVILALPLVPWAVGRVREGRWRRLAWSAVGFLAALAVLMLPFFGHGRELYHNFAVAYNSFSGEFAPFTGKLVSFFGEVASLYGALACIAAILLAAQAAQAVRRREWWDAMPFVFFAAFSAVCVFKRAYVFRSVYALPYIVVAVAEFSVGGALRRRGLQWAAWGLCAAMFFLSSCYWPVRTLTAYNVRDTARLVRELEREVGRDVGIYCDTFQPYYAGRLLGWRQYRMWCGQRKGMEDILVRDDVRFYLGDGMRPDADKSAMLTALGFRFEKVIMPGELLTWDARRLWRLGPYNLWGKSAENQ